MHTNTLTALALLSSLASAMPAANLSPRQPKACFVVGNQALPAETSAAVAQVQNNVTCAAGTTTIDTVPDVTSGSQTFSKINFATSGKTPLAFALDQFKTSEPLAQSNLATFQDALNVYIATEAGLRSTGSKQVDAIKVPKFFLAMQVSRIMTAQGNPPAAAGQQVDHLRDKVKKNVSGADKALVGQVDQVAAQVK